MATESLTIAGQIELLGGGVASTIPACSGAVFLLAPGYDLGAPQPVADITASLFLDGERPVGRRASNRTITLPIKITAPDRLTLAAAREVLLQLVDQQIWQMQWTRPGGLPMMFDCFRAEPTVMAYALEEEQQLVSRLSVTFTALPYGRSDVPTLIDFQSAIAGRSAPAASVTVDNYSTVTGTHWTQATIGPGPNSAWWSTGTSGVGLTTSYTRSGVGPFNLTGLTGLSFWLGLGSTSYFPYYGLRLGGVIGGTVIVKITLTDGTASTTFHVMRNVKMTNNSVSPYWQKVRVPLPSSTPVNLAAVTGYTVTISSRTAGDFPYTDVYLDSLTAVPYVTQGVVSPNFGMWYDFAGVVGTARAPYSVQCQQPSSTAATVTKKITLTGAGNFLAPQGMTHAKVEGYSGGARGGNNSGSFGGGGGGCEYVAEVLPFTPGTVYPYSVGAGGIAPTGNAGNTTITGDSGLGITAHGPANVADGSATGGAGGTGATVLERLSTANQGFEGSIGTWVAATNGAAPTDTAAQHHSGSNSMQMSSSAAGDMIYASVIAGSVVTGGALCDPSMSVKVNGWVRTAVSARSCSAGAEFYDKNGASLGQLFGATVTDSTSAWTALTQATLTPPANSVYCRALVKVAATGGAAEVHYADDMSVKTGLQANGGAGGNGAGGPFGGGGGGGAGPTGAGSAGAAGNVSGAGGAGGGGDAGAGGNSALSGNNGNLRGGGGAGSGTGITRGSGGNGELVLTYQQTATFKTLVIHRPGPDAPDTLCPFVPVGVNDTPDGNTEYLVPSLVTGSNARFGSTYTVYLVANAWNNPSSSHTVTVTVRQYEQAGGNVYSQAISRTLTPNSLASNLVNLGELTIPSNRLPDDNVNCYFAITVTSGNTSDRFQDVLFLDTRGSSVVIESPRAYVSYWVDEPPIDTELGNIMGSLFDRNDASTVLDSAQVSGPPLFVDPNNAQGLLLYCADGVSPSALVTYWPRWWFDRTA